MTTLFLHPLNKADLSYVRDQLVSHSKILLSDKFISPIFRYILNKIKTQEPL